MYSPLTSQRQLSTQEPKTRLTTKIRVYRIRCPALALKRN